MKTREKLINTIDKSVKTIEHINKHHGKNESHQQMMNMNKHVRINEHNEQHTSMSTMETLMNTVVRNLMNTVENR